MSERQFILNILLSLCFCDHMGDVSNVMLDVFEKLGIEPSSDKEWPQAEIEALEKAGAKTLWTAAEFGPPKGVTEEQK